MEAFDVRYNRKWGWLRNRESEKQRQEVFNLERAKREVVNLNVLGELIRESTKLEQLCLQTHVRTRLIHFVVALTCRFTINWTFKKVV